MRLFTNDANLLRVIFPKDPSPRRKRRETLKTDLPPEARGNVMSRRSSSTQR
jgi:hypothetical protein